MHGVDPSQYPLAPDAQYVPSPHTLSDALAFEATLGLRNIVLVQPSIYGNDNSCLLDALKRIGPKQGRGVVAIDPSSVTTETLEMWHGMGVRGARVNLKSTGETMEPSVFEARLRECASRIAAFGWVLQLYVSLDMVPLLEHLVPQLGVKVCLDHFASPSLPSASSPHDYNPYDLPGFSSLVSLLREGSTYVKISGAYRISSDPELRDLRPLAMELLRVAGTRSLVFATDWPHTRFEGLDIRPFVEKVVEWCEGDDRLIERVFKGNAEDLWDVGEQ